jgi:hypothetical protein
MAECRTCGHDEPAITMVAGLCDGCRLDTWIPPGYQKREKYVFIEAYGYSNATCRPKLGVEFLDHPHPLLAEQFILSERK